MNNNEKEEALTNPLGCAPIPGLIRKFAIPSIISLAVSAAYNVTDQIFIGHVVGMLGNAATNVAFPITTLALALAELIGIGAAANFNISMGAKRINDAKNYISSGIVLMAIVGVLLMSVIFACKTPVLMLCGATEQSLPYAQQYLSIAVFGLPFFLFATGSSPLIRADGSPAYSMICVVGGAVLNVFLDWVFMFVLPLGIQGAAAATVISQIVSFFLCVLYFAHFKTFVISLKMLKVRLNYAVNIAKLGAANFINHAIMMLVNVVMNNSLAYHGASSVYGSDIPLAVSGVVAKLDSILAAFSIGLALGCQPIWGYNMGAGNYDRVKKTFKTALMAALGISATAFLLFQLFPREIVSVFGTGNELYFQFAERYMRIYLFMICVFGVQPLAVNYFTGTGNTKLAIALCVSRQGLFLIPLMLLLPLWFGIEGVLYAGPIADFLAFTLSLILVCLNFKKLKQ